MEIKSSKCYDMKQWSIKFAFFPKTMSGGEVIWLERYKQRAVCYNFDPFDFYWEYRRIK